jgi:pyruvate kinase
MRHTKIICTIGPASETVKDLEMIINVGMNVARLNFSHGVKSEHLQRIKNIREAVENTGKNIAILLDTKGPEIRIGELKKTIFLEKDRTLVLTSDDVIGDEEKMSVSYN